jgi:L-2-hydroxyglutarate oxidase
MAYDFVVAGGGVMGVAIARNLLTRLPKAKVLILEKEPSLGFHASGRNSGVLHAGFYYSPDSLKARFTRMGNEFWRAYAQDNKIPLNQCGKLVVPTNDVELKGLKELHRRGQVNGVTLELITAREAAKIEPKANVFEEALWSPNTATIEIKTALAFMAKEVQSLGAKFELAHKVLRVQRHGRSVRVSYPRGQVDCAHFINCAGLYADELAKQMGFSKDYRILPFKGLYLYADESQKLNCHIYPVPDPAFPFLGVHFTVTVDGHLKMGPTAIPAFWRENYTGVDRFNAREFASILRDEAQLFLTNAFNFRTLALKEMPKYIKSRMANDGGRLVKGLNPKAFKTWGKPGIRAQLLHVPSKKLEMDFVVEGDDVSTHVLNSVSPAWTCAVPFAEHVVDKIIAAPPARKTPEPVMPLA